MRILSKIALTLSTAALLAGPWLFGAWEAWWFWPLATLLFVAIALFGVTLLDAESIVAGFSERLLRRDVAPLLVAIGVFLAYAIVRMFMARVYADAERSLLLFVLPLFVAGIAAYSAGPAGRRVLVYLLAFNILCLGLYGLVNHWLTGSERVMWMPGYLQYYADNRASGSYFCPNHFAGILELGAALALGLMADRGVKWGGRLFALLLLAVCVAGVILSKSRGGGVTLLALLLLAPFTGLVQWRPRARWLVRAGVALLSLAAAGLVAWQAVEYRGRFAAFPWDDVEKSDRVQMVKGALRAWQTAPVLGIGPGMHQSLWSHFAASPDGDREKGIWPTRLNTGWHSYEVHNDWVQLLEEYGALGLALFLAVLGLLLRGLWRGLRREEEEWQAAQWAAPGQPRFTGIIAAGLLAAAAMILHEAVDFNLQMPATGWVLGAILGLAVAESTRAQAAQ
jgi:O-antigen ligase